MRYERTDEEKKATLAFRRGANADVHANPDDESRRYSHGRAVAHFDSSDNFVVQTTAPDDEYLGDTRDDYVADLNLVLVDNDRDENGDEIDYIDLSELPYEDNPWNHLRRMNPATRRSREKPTRRDERAASLLHTLTPERRVTARLGNGRKYMVGVNTIVHEFRALRHNGDFASCVQRCLKAT